MSAFYRTCRYHLGSLALGSMIIAIVQFIRYLLMKLEYALKGKSNPFLQYLLKCLQCLFLCVQRFLEFLNTNAYIEIAVYGYSFCKAAKRAFDLILRNIVRIVTVHKLGDFLLFCGKLIVSVGSAALGNYLIATYADDPTFWVVPVLTIFVISYCIAYVFMSVLDMAINTIFLSFCEDGERNDGSADKPYYCVKQLSKYMDKSEATKKSLGD
eukprot:Lithocolla_globosa_v1_NODE_1836_length_2305_cov_1.876444.p2 type:complete len:212 gc:universal NODE_1836_length_2305_cov_1.876444:1523-2158(+)